MNTHKPILFNPHSCVFIGASHALAFGASSQLPIRFGAIGLITDPSAASVPGGYVIPAIAGPITFG